MSKENIENITKSNSSFAPTFVDYHVLPDINFNGHCLMNNIHIPKKSYICDIIYIYIYDSQIVHHNPRFNLFILHNNSFDNQGSKINKNDIFFTFRHTILYKNFLPTYFFHFKDILRN